MSRRVTSQAPSQADKRRRIGAKVAERVPEFPGQLTARQRADAVASLAQLLQDCRHYQGSAPSSLKAQGQESNSDPGVCLPPED